MAQTPPEPKSRRLEFDEFYGHEYKGLLRLAYGLTGSGHAAEELVQDTMLKVLRHWAKVRDYDRPDAWARRVLLNHATSNGRRRQAEKRALGRIGRGAAAVDGPSPDGAAIVAALARLPERDAHAIALHYFSDMSVLDIAEVLGCAEGTVKTLLYRGRNALARELGEEEDA